MLETIRSYYPIIAIILVLLLIVAIWHFGTVLHAIFAKLAVLATNQEASQNELHAVAAHFVPRLRTVKDVAMDHEFSWEQSHAVDATSQFHQNLNKKQ
jgi:hypothetical protein